MIDLQKPDFLNTPISEQRPVYEYIPQDVRAEPVISIITPYYNTGAIFLETAKSVLGQSFQQWEWVIVNDGSTNPQALEVLEPFRVMDKRIRVVDQANAGLAGARNTGIRASHAPFLFFLDSDDLLEPTTIEYLLWKVYTDERVSFATGHLVGFGAQHYIWSNGFNTTARFLEENMVSVMAVVRREVIEHVGMFDVKREIATEDYDFWLRCAAHDYWGADVPLPLLWYRRRPVKANGDIRDQQERYDLFRQEMRSKYADLYKQGMPAPIIDDITQHTVFYPASDTLDFHNILMKPEGVRRMLILVPWMSLGGADKFNLDLIDQLTQRGWQITVCSTLNDEISWQSEFTRRTPDVFVLPSFLRQADMPRFIRYLIQSRQIDTLLIANSMLGYTLLPYVRSHFPDIAICDYMHMEEEYWHNGGYPRLSLSYTPYLDLSMVSSEHLRNWMIKRGAEPTKLAVCTTNIDAADWDPARYDRLALRNRLGVGNYETLLLYAGRLTQQKQPKVFAQVMLELVQRGQQFSAIVAGDGPDRQWLEDFIAEHELTSVQMLGSVSNQYMRELLAAADIFFLPSAMEGISLAMYEAMAMGVVPVGADVGGQSELVTTECGILIKHGPHEVDEYARALSLLIGNVQLRRAMSEAARQRICEHYSLDLLGERFEYLIKSIKKPCFSIHYSGEANPIAMSLAVSGLELIRLDSAVERLWIERSHWQREAELQSALVQQLSSSLSAIQESQRQVSRQARLRLAVWHIRRSLWPIYDWSVNHGMGWLVPVRDRLFDLVSRVFRSAL